MNKPKIVMGFIYDEEKGYQTLEEYNKQVRAEVIDEFRKFNYCKVCEEKGWDIYCEYCRVCQAQEYIAEQLKEQNK